MRQIVAACVLLVAILTGVFVAAQGGRFVTVNEVRLHYVEWGGLGEAILFLPGLGDTVDRFDSVAPRLADRFRVLGLTRRGQGLSEQPPSGYDTRTLATDIRAFLDALQIQKVTLIGHSIAGIEMTMFANLWPERLNKLVYLDAEFGDIDTSEARKQLPSLGRIDPVLDAISSESGGTTLTGISVPALAYFALFDTMPDNPNWDEQTRKWNEAALRIFEPLKRQSIKRFQTEVRLGRVVQLRDTNHFFFLDPKLTDQVVREIREFLLNN